MSQIQTNTNILRIKVGILVNNMNSSHKIRRYKLSKRGANFFDAGLEVKPDWRYDLIQDYLHASPSYQIVLAANKNRYYKRYPLPPDHKLVRKVVEDFGEILQEEGRWWQATGMKLYGIAAPRPEVQVIASLNDQLKEVKVIRDNYQALVIKVPTIVTQAEAFRQFKKIISNHGFASELPQSIKPKYTLLKSKLRQETLQNGLIALNRYLKGYQLWEIGNDLSLVSAQCISVEDSKLLPANELYYRKNILSIAARRLIRQAALIAENAARGKFPTDRFFPEAVLTPYSRTAGRPRSDLDQASRKNNSGWSMLGGT